MKATSKTAIVSPSGNLYGSEQVLLDFLKNTTRQYIVFLPRQSLLYKEVLALERHRIKQFRPDQPIGLYIRLTFMLLLKSIKSVYVNEGGHIRYIKLLAYFFRRVKFIVHLRMVYDADESRLGRNTFSNIQLIAISNHVAQRIPVKWSYDVIYDPYVLKKDGNQNTEVPVTLGSVFRVGIIGRISPTKGFIEIASLLRELESSGVRNIVFNFYGSFSDDDTVRAKAKEVTAYKNVKVVFNGFVQQSEIYNNIDCVCHFCEDEGLGRVFFESIDWLKPFIGFKKGGLIEIAAVFRLENFLIEKDGLWERSFIHKLDYTQRHYKEAVFQVKSARNNFTTKFTMHEYLNKIETLI